MSADAVAPGSVIGAVLWQMFESSECLGHVKRWPQTRGPVMRIAPKPRRWISMASLILNEPDLRASSGAISNPFPRDSKRLVLP
jgi:hypothetical protein